MEERERESFSESEMRRWEKSFIGTMWTMLPIRWNDLAQFHWKSSSHLSAFLCFVSFFLRNVFHRTLWQLKKIYGECLSSRDNKRHHNLKAFFPFDNKRDECDDVMHRGAISLGLRETTVTNTTVKSCAKQLTARSFRKFGIWIKNGKLFALSFVFIISKAL